MEQGASSHSYIYDCSRKKWSQSSHWKSPGKAALSSNLDWIGWKFHKTFPNHWTLEKWHNFEENQKWLLMTSSQTQTLGSFDHFQKRNLCLSRNFSWSFHRTALVLVPRFSRLNLFWLSSLNKENPFWLFRRGFLKT